jgi:hypothetical protein
MIPILQKAQAAYLAKVNPRLQPVVQKLVSAGHQIMFSPQTRHMMQQQLQAGPSNPEVIGAGIAKLVALLYHESKKTAPVQALIPAGMLLLFDGLQFLSDAGAVQVTPQFLAQCTQAAGSALLQMLGVKPEQMQAAIDQARAKAQPAAAPGAPGAMPPAPAPRGIVGAAMGS